MWFRGILLHDTLSRSALAICCAAHLPHIVQGRGVFTGQNTVEVNCKTLRFFAAVIAAGATAAVPGIKGLKVFITGFSVCVKPRRPSQLALRRLCIEVCSFSSARELCSATSK